MSDREKARRAEQSRRDRRDRERGSFTVSEWCEYRRISRGMFYKLDEKGQAPRSHFAGAKRLISDEADADWIKQRETAAEHAAA